MYPLIARVDRGGAPQQALSFLRIPTEPAWQLDQHLSLCGQQLGIIWRQHQGSIEFHLCVGKLTEYGRHRE
jgi:hypothetical protein